MRRGSRIQRPVQTRTRRQRAGRDGSLFAADARDRPVMPAKYPTWRWAVRISIGTAALSTALLMLRLVHQWPGTAPAAAQTAEVAAPEAETPTGVYDISELYNLPGISPTRPVRADLAQKIQALADEHLHHLPAPQTQLPPMPQLPAGSHLPQTTSAVTSGGRTVIGPQ